MIAENVIHHDDFNSKRVKAADVSRFRKLRTYNAEFVEFDDVLLAGNRDLPAW